MTTDNGRGETAAALYLPQKGDTSNFPFIHFINPVIIGVRGFFMLQYNHSNFKIRILELGTREFCFLLLHKGDCYVSWYINNHSVYLHYGLSGFFFIENKVIHNFCYDQ